MNWFNHNRWLGTFLVVFGIATIGALYFLFSAKGSSDETLAKFQEAVNEKKRLERLDPFPSEANHRKMKLHLENYSTALNKLKDELKTRVPNPPALAPNEFQTRLRQSMVAVTDRARANRVKLPDNFALGFEEYTAALPNTDMAPLLGQELTQIESLINLLIDAHVDGVTAFSRKPLPNEHGAAPGSTPAATPVQTAVANAPPGKQLIDRGTVELSFAAAPSAARKVLNQVVSSPQQFYIVRLLHVHDEKDKGPPREQPAQGAAGAVAAQATPAKAPGTGALNFIVGNEHIETSARIELLRFNF